VTPQPTIAAPTQAPAAAPPPSVVAPAPTPPSPPATFPPVTNATLTSFDPAAAPARLSTREVSRGPEQGAPRSGLRRLGVAVAAIALIGLGGAVTLWAQRGDRASWLLSRLGSDRAIGEEDRAVVVPVPARESEPKLAEPDAAPAAPDLSAAIDAPPSGPRAEVVPPSVESPLAGEPAAPSAQAAPAQQATARGDQAGDVAEPEPKPEDRTAAEAAALHVETPAEAEADAIDETPPTAPVVAPAASDDVPERTAAVAVEARAEAKAETQEVRSEPEPPEDARQAAIPSRPESSGGSARRMQVRSGDTLSNLANRAYGHANLTTLDMLRERNPRISDIDLILAGEEIEFPDPGPSARVLRRETGLSVLALTTPELVQALAIQEALEARYERPVDLEPTELGRRRDLYRVSIRALGGRGEALEIASRLGSILEDPGS
jgi:phage tail protein X